MGRTNEVRQPRSPPPTVCGFCSAPNHLARKDCEVCRRPTQTPSPSRSSSTSGSSSSESETTSSSSELAPTARKRKRGDDTEEDAAVADRRKQERDSQLRQSVQAALKPYPESKTRASRREENKKHKKMKDKKRKDKKTKDKNKQRAGAGAHLPFSFPPCNIFINSCFSCREGLRDGP